MEYTGSAEFTTKFSALVANKILRNTDRAAAVESFILQEAVTAGVVREKTLTSPRNPNKWGITLAPWFTEQCREAKREMARARRTYGRND